MLPENWLKLFDIYDDLYIIHNDLTDHSGLTLCAIAKNEIYFIQAFFDHYRSLGVERFIILDDQSDDGTREFLFQQADCMVLGSQKTFGEVTHILKKEIPAYTLWTNILIRKYAVDRWTLLVDIDEFLRLPDGMILQELISRLEAARTNTLWASMLDVYPARSADLLEMKHETTLNLGREWFFDGRPHLVFRKRGNYIRQDYPGSRARLMRHFRVPIKRPWITRAKILLRRLLSRQFIPFFNKIEKSPLFKLPKDGYFLDPHTPHYPVQSKFIFPLEHYKFTGQIFDRVQFAVTSNAHYKESIDYKYLALLLAQMEQEQASFLGPYSTRRGSFQAYLDTGVVQEFGWKLVTGKKG